MAYNKSNYMKSVRRMVEVYGILKEYDKPDTQIVSQEFPKHNIFISYRQWMNIKNMKQPKNEKQLALFP